MERSKLGIVIPAYNEAASIAVVIRGVSNLGQPIVVNDNSTDNTGIIAKEAGAIVVTHEVNGGYDRALDSGFQQAELSGCEFVITMDADGQHEPAMLQEYIDRLDSGVDLVLGIRDNRQRFSEHLFAWLTRIQWGIHDPLCGMKGYSMDIYRKLGYFDSYGSIGTQLAIFGVRSGYSFEQVHVVTRERLGESRFGKFIRANYLILRAALLSIFLTHPSRT